MVTNSLSVTALMQSVTESVTTKTLKNQCGDRCDKCDNLARTCACDKNLTVNNLLLTCARKPVTPVTPVTVLKNKEKTCHTNCHSLEKAVTPLELRQ